MVDWKAKAVKFLILFVMVFLAGCSAIPSHLQGEYCRIAGTRESCHKKLGKICDLLHPHGLVYAQLRYSHMHKAMHWTVWFRNRETGKAEVIDTHRVPVIAGQGSFSTIDYAGGPLGAVLIGEWMWKFPNYYPPTRWIYENLYAYLGKKEYEYYLYWNGIDRDPLAWKN